MPGVTGNSHACTQHAASYLIAGRPPCEEFRRKKKRVAKLDEQKNARHFRRIGAHTQKLATPCRPRPRLRDPDGRVCVCPPIKMMRASGGNLTPRAAAGGRRGGANTKSSNQVRCGGRGQKVFVIICHARRRLTLKSPTFFFISARAVPHPPPPPLQKTKTRATPAP